MGQAHFLDQKSSNGNGPICLIKFHDLGRKPSRNLAYKTLLFNKTIFVIRQCFFWGEASDHLQLLTHKNIVINLVILCFELVLITIHTHNYIHVCTLQTCVIQLASFHCNHPLPSHHN